ncbi:MAG: ribonuclease III [Elusimicrobiota bacterium]
MNEDLNNLEKRLKVRFKNKALLAKALTHKSYSEEKKVGYSNERLEFLGDSVLSLVVATYLYQNHPESEEGKLSQLKSILVSRQSFYEWAKEYELGKYLFLSASEELTGGRERESLMSNAMEAVVGAMYIDKGFGYTSKFITDYLSTRKRIITRDYKSKLQEETQKRYKTIPVYKLVKEAGPDHDKIFTVVVEIEEKVFGIGAGKNKKDAEQNAAREALGKF